MMELLSSSTNVVLLIYRLKYAVKVVFCFLYTFSIIYIYISRCVLDCIPDRYTSHSNFTLLLSWTLPAMFWQSTRHYRMRIAAGIFT